MRTSRTPVRLPTLTELRERRVSPAQSHLFSSLTISRLVPMTFNEQLRIQQTDADEQTLTLCLLTGDRIAVEIVDGDEDGTTIDLTLSLTEAETLMAKLAVMVAQARIAKESR